MNILDKAEKMYKKKGVRNVVTCAAVIVSALLQSFVIQTFIRPAELLSGGFTGIAILVDMAASKFGMSFPTSLGMLVFNLPVAALCSRSISKRFTAFSLLQVCTSSIFLQIFHFSPLFDDVVLNVVFGGFLLGISIVVALKGNASTGGTDFIALYVSNKTGRSIWGEVFVGNCVLFCIFGMAFGWLNAAYSILFQFISTKTISTFHHRYDRVTLQVTTLKGDEIMKEYVSAFRHGISALDAIGGYSRKKMFVLHTVISSYELDDVIRLMREVDPHVIINVFKTDQFFGSFYRAPMD
ncbi:YitT family protein [Otoolea muris]|uniref:YitT family protein n=1 Tax=Otoolea muris TaxID=2941515 RepID=UPI002040AA51|nr:YitT family protein [Otoolea muris]